MKFEPLIQAMEQLKAMVEHQQAHCLQLSLAVSQLLGYIKGEAFKQQRSRRKEGPDTNSVVMQQNNTPSILAGTANPTTMLTSMSKQMSVVLQSEEEVKKYKGKTIRRRSDGRWWVRYYDKDKVQRSIYGKTQNECLQKLKEALKQVAEGEKPSKCTTLGEWLQRWMDLYKVGKLKHSTLEQMQRYLREVEPIANKRLTALTAMDVQGFLNSISAPRKREKLYIMLKDALTKAEKNKLLKDNPIDAVDRPKTRKKKARALTVEEEQVFVEACREIPQGNLYLLCLYQGLRLGEALALTWEDVDLDKGTISVSKTMDNDGNVTSPKTETSIRVLPIFKRTVDVLQGMERGEGYLFKSKMTVYQNRMARLARKLCLENIHTHSLRHTFATRCSEAGIAPKLVQKWLGHSTIEMTLNVYTHVNGEFEQKAVSEFDTYFDTH